MDGFDLDRFAVIADVHGNVDALLAVLHDIDRQGIASILNLGDHLSGPLAARDTADLMMELTGMVSVRGNHDRALTETPPGHMGPSDRAAYGQLDPAHLDWLRSLPAVLDLGGQVFMCHGTPLTDDRYWLEALHPEGHLYPAPLSRISAEAEGIACGLMLCAHSHLAGRVDLPDGRVIVNPGSVGCPAYADDTPVFHRVEARSPHARYAVMTRGRAGSGDQAGWDSRLCHVGYDPARMIAMAVAQGRADWAGALRHGTLPESGSDSALAGMGGRD